MFCNKNKLSWDDFDGLREVVKSLVKEKRYIHTLGVEEEAIRLADIFGCGDDLIKKFRSAAILHDITKEFDLNKQLDICDKYKIKLSKDDLRVNNEWHAKTAAYIARIEFGADDIIFNAIYYHTLGTYKSYALSSKIIYLADYMEPNRTFKDCVEVRDYFYSEIENAKALKEKYNVLDDTMLFSIDKTLKTLIKEKYYIHKNTMKYRNSFINPV